MSLTISLAQMDIVLGDPAANFKTVREVAVEAKARSTDVLVLPELWSTAYDLENACQHATPTNSGIFAQVSDLALELGMHIVGSCLATLGPQQYGNTMTWHSDSGDLLGTYSKLHLFRLMNEEQFLAPGPSLTQLDMPWGQTGLAICYDLRFPEMFRRYALDGATIVFLSAEWPHPRLTHWRTLLQARAIENQCFIVACNRVGSKGDTDFFGHSTIIDPWGERIIEGGEEAALLTATIAPSVVASVRKKIPVFADRRPELY